MKDKLKVVDIFSGAGGFSKGFEDAGYEIVDFVEFDKWASETYRHNINVTNKDRVTLDMFKSKDIKTFIDYNKDKDIDVLIGGFPCQGYSLIGLRGVDDPRNQLYKPTLKIIDELNPKIFVLENVPGILSMNNGDDVKDIIKRLNKTGWEVQYKVLDSSNFSVPQSRKRVFFIGTKDERISIDNIFNKLLSRNDKKIPISFILKDVDKEFKDDVNHVKTNHREDIKARMIALKEGESLYKNFAGGTKKLHWNKPSPTIRDNHGGTFIHPKKNRYLTAREIGLLQTFDGEFEFKGPKTRQLKQIGNAVPVKLSKEIAEEIKKWLK